MGDIPEADRAAAGQGMLGGDDKIQRVVPHRHGADQVMRFRRQSDDRQLGAAVEDFLVGDLRIEELDIQRHLRILPGEGP